MKSRLITLTHKGQTALVYPERGFQLYGYEAIVRGKRTRVIHADPEAAEPADRRYGNPILFPSPSITCTDKGRDTWERKGKILPIPSHGVARDIYWFITESTENSVTAVATPKTSTSLMFPFQFKLTGRYTLDERGLVLDMTVENMGEKTFPYGLGFHPYLLFNRSGTSGKIDCNIALPRGKRLLSNDGWLSFKEENPYGPTTIHPDDEALNTTIMLLDTGVKHLEIENKTDGDVVKVSVEKSPESMPVWAIWRPEPSAPFVCVEPWSDYVNCLNRKETRKCAPGDAHQYQMVISIREL